MKNNRSVTNWLIDAALFGSFIVLFFLELTGLALHQWLGIVCGALALYHLARHWKWVKAVGQRLLGGTTWQARLYYLVDAFLLLGFGVILVSGLMISTWLNAPLGDAARTLVDLHLLTSQAALLLVVLKVALHWRWIAKTARQITLQSNAPSAKFTPEIYRRDFIKLMGMVGIAAALALLYSTRPTATTNAQAPSPQAPDLQELLTPRATSQPSNSSPSCTKRCPRGRSCSYPGSCRLYTDSNGNNRCDLGECL